MYSRSRFDICSTNFTYWSLYYLLACDHTPKYLRKNYYCNIGGKLKQGIKPTSISPMKLHNFRLRFTLPIFLADNK